MGLGSLPLLQWVGCVTAIIAIAMPIRAIASAISEHALAAASSLGMGLVSGVCYIVGMAPASGVVLDAATQVQASPYVIGSVFIAGCSATWVVAMLIGGLRRDVRENGKASKNAYAALGAKIDSVERRLDSIDDKREASEKQLAVMQAHINDCPHRGDHGRRK